MQLTDLQLRNTLDPVGGHSAVTRPAAAFHAACHKQGNRIYQTSLPVLTQTNSSFAVAGAPLIPTGVRLN